MANPICNAMGLNEKRNKNQNQPVRKSYQLKMKNTKLLKGFDQEMGKNFTKKMLALIVA